MEGVKIMNLLTETMDCLNKLNVEEDDIYGVYDGKVFLDWGDFKKLAFQVNYDNGYGSQKINQSLLIYTKKVIMYRYEYDGSEQWFYIPIISKDALLNPIRYDDIKQGFKGEKFLIRSEYEWADSNFDNNFIDEYQKYLDYKGGYIK